MPKFMLLLALMSLSIPAVAEENPLLKPWSGPHGGVPPFDEVTPERLGKALEQSLESYRDDAMRIARNPELPTFENTIAALEHAGDEFERVTILFEIYSSNMNNPEIQTLEREWSPRFSAISDEVIQNQELFGRIDAIYQTRDAEGRAVYHFPEDVEVTESGATLKATGEAVEVIPSAKMSKSKKNVVDPLEIIAQYGADTARWFVMSDSPPERDVEWTASGAEGASKHLARVYRIAAEIAEATGTGEGDEDLLREMHKTIKAVTDGIEGFAFNTSIAKLYGFTNTLSKSKAGAETKQTAMRVMAQLMAPMTPHLAEEVWAMLGGQGLVAEAEWPVADEAMLVEDTVTMPIQVNGKRRDEITVPKDMDKAEVEKLALDTDGVKRALDGNAPKKVIVVPGRIVNVVA